MQLYRQPPSVHILTEVMREGKQIFPSLCTTKVRHKIPIFVTCSRVLRKVLLPFWCIEKFTLNERQNRYKCLQLKNQKEFHVDAYQDGFTNGTKTGVEVVIYSSRNTKRVKEEMFVLTTEDFIGSVGGSLGLFLGFSFFTYLLEIIQNLYIEIKSVFFLAFF